ncbi:MAG TPA: succinate dehydrogenase assembly factor 2 [Alphaproteobacteria bacterium]|jgi:antitoxin CptB|nr:succinate dehydrogenase assembly factor 2 [Micavibrio sp.]MBK9561559.1 succinate dehydrogenase assembly factor 2 [Micavibrio sp.]HQX27733.1 succinate dehydrogenase assembly factor 2 [Alphaproteobacteria bacterium]
MGSAHTIEDIEIRRKRLVYRAWHRGTREMDLILGSFADKNVAGFSDAELDEFEGLLQLQDPDLYNWITGTEPVPANVESDLFTKLKSHRP